MISSAEWEIMRVVWAHDGITGKEVADYLNDKTEWKITTVKTLLSRLVNKHVLRTEKCQNKYIYFANIDEDEYDYQVLEAVFDRICQKDYPKMLAKLIDKTTLTLSDKQNLIKQLEAKETVDVIPCTCTAGQCRCARRRG